MKYRRYMFDFVCDETPLLCDFASRVRGDGAEISSIVMGNRWKTYWTDFNATSYDIAIQKGRGEFSDITARLTRLQKEYGEFNPASFILKDRFVSSLGRQYSFEILVHTFERIEAAISEMSPDIFISTGVAYLYNLVSLAVCYTKGIPHFSIYDVRRPSPRFTISKTIGGQWELINDHFAKIENGEIVPSQVERDFAEDTLQTFRNRPSVPAYMKSARQSTSLRAIYIEEFFKRCHNYYLKGWGKNGDYITQHPIWYAKRELKRIVKGKILSYVIKFDDSFIDKSDRPFYLYPLHLEPEASTLVLTEHYNNQLEVVRQLSKTIPVDSLLYVKEHISSLGRRSNDFYREILAIPNVRLISHKIPSFSLILKSQGIFTITGTMGWEAVMLGKPVIILGNVFYRHLFDPSVFYTNIDEIPKKLSQPDSLVVSKGKVVNFLVSMYQCSRPGLFDVVKMDGGENVMSENNRAAFHEGLVDLIEND